MFNKLVNTLQSFVAPKQPEPQQVEKPVEPVNVEKSKTEKAAVKKPKAVKQPKEKTTNTLSPKDLATKKKEPWVDVVSFNVNKDNIRHGFYELDWNQYFVDKLRSEGYGYDGDPDEEVVNRWFKEICINAALAEGVDIDPSAIGQVDLSGIH